MPSRLNPELRSDIRLFAFYLANGTLCDEVLEDLDYSELLDEPSELEMVFAIWSNVLVVGNDGKPENTPAASRRVAQYIRSRIEPSYAVIPPFQDWEQELL